MKNSYKISSLILLLLLVFTGCDDNYIDPITAVDPGSDAGAPVVEIIKPINGFEIQVPEPIASVDIEFKVQDDIEIATVSVELDGSEIASFDTFTDYRVALQEFTYDNVTTGEHILTVIGTDIAGNVSTSSVNFTKEPPYTPIFLGETFYMGFEGSYTDLVSITDATEVGSPGFAGMAKVGNDAYAGATDSYLSFPTDGLLGNEFSASFWMNVNATPDRAGILVIGPEDTNNPDAQNNRTSGFRFFRENAGGMQRFKLNVGNGTADSWFDGGANADVMPDTGEWNHFAFTISDTEVVVYINGEIASQGAFTGVDWTGCDILSIMSGVPRFSGWNHKSDLSYMDELRLFSVALTQEDVVEQIALSSQKFYMPFDGVFTDKISDEDPSEVGSPSITTDSYEGNGAYAGATDSYLTFPTDGLLGSEFSASFWMNVNATPDRAGILVIGPEDTNNPDAQNDRSKGFRFFRENAGGEQRFKLNVGHGAGDNWFDGGDMADVIPDTGEWNHFAFTISGTECVVYLNGEIASQGAFAGVDWTGCDILSIMSGAPRFTGWNHKSDLSYMDELRIFDKALSQAEVQAIYN